MTADPGFSLVVPFVVCESEGGSYDDQAFVAGFECGRLDVVLAGQRKRVEMVVRAASLPQVDLLAMRHGYVLEAEPWEEAPDEWVLASLVPCDDGDSPWPADA